MHLNPKARHISWTIELDPLEVASQGSVSETFKLSLAQWNKTKTSGNLTPQQLPNAQ